MEVLPVGFANKFVGVKIANKTIDSEVVPILTICTEEIPSDDPD